MLGHAGVQAPRHDSRYRVCSFGANLLHLGNVGKQVSRRFLGLQLFGHFVSYLLGLSNAHTSMGATFAL